jgi:hypothetical protein
MKPTVCPTCYLSKRGFWETEYEMSCSDCREKASRAAEENRLRKAVKSGKIKPNQLTPLGLKVCGLASL